MFICVWDEDDGPETLAVDVPDEAKAREFARAIEGSEPSRVICTGPGVFAVSIAFVPDDDDEDGDGEVLEISPATKELGDLLEVIEAAEDAPLPSPSESAGRCGDVAGDGAGGEVECDLAMGHEGEHRGKSPAGAVFGW